MFTGIISNLGKISGKSSSKLTILVDKKFGKNLTLGSSVAVNGICLTVVSQTQDSFTSDYMPETYAKTNLSFLNRGDLVNLELPATPTTFLSGHIVQGHIDGVAKLKSITNDKNSRILKFSIPQSLSKIIVEKGSVALNGISLTVIEAGKGFFTVGIIPHTWDSTMLHTIKTGDLLNLEVDILAKYVKRLIQR